MRLPTEQEIGDGVGGLVEGDSFGLVGHRWPLNRLHRLQLDLGLRRPVPPGLFERWLGHGTTVDFS